jgi:orotidine-5'-phosphate decarboxylase
MKEKGFADRIKLSSKSHSSRIVLALDIVAQKRYQLRDKALSMLNTVSQYIAAVKINYHLLLPLSLFTDIKKIINFSHDRGLQTIADLKLNDISSTNLIASNYLWDVGFDAIIANPFVGYEEGLEPIVKKAHEINRGLILLAYMSHKSAREGYGLTILSEGLRQEKMYEFFVRRAIEWCVDGVIVGANDLDILSSIASKVKGRMLVFSPGVGAQGGDPLKAIMAGADFLIVGRSILDSKDPLSIINRINRVVGVIK